MQVIDRLFDSFRKRLFWLSSLAAILFIVSLVRNYLCAYELADVSSIEELISFSDNPYLFDTFLGNLAGSYLDSTDSLVICFLKSFGIARVFGFVFCLLVLFSRLNERERSLKVFVLIGMIQVFLEYAMIAYFGILALNTSTVTIGIRSVQIAGQILKYFSLYLMIYTLCSLFYLFFHFFIEIEN